MAACNSIRTSVQRATPDGEIVYGIFDTKPHAPFPSCNNRPPEVTMDEPEACVQQAKKKPPRNPSYPDVCTKGANVVCVDPGRLRDCPLPNETPFPEDQPCLRRNKLVCPGRPLIEDIELPKVAPDSAGKCVDLTENVTNCLPRYSPRESLRSVNFLGTPYLSHLLGSLSTIASIHPEAPIPNSTETQQIMDTEEEPVTDYVKICPFSSFKVYNEDFDYAEVGYQTRITGEISYYGTSVPTEADLKIEYERTMGVVVEISSSVEEQRGLTTVRKTIDIRFEMTDYVRLTSTKKYFKIT